MANVKFSQFTNQSATPTTFIVGYDGAINVRIPSDGIAPYVQEQAFSSGTKQTMSSSRPLVDNTSVSFISRITAVKTSTGDTWCATLKGGSKKVSGVSSKVDTETLEVFAYDPASINWEVTSNTTATAIDFSVNSNGDASQIRWRIETIFNEVAI
jgi:hypothetical protein